jgi:hypothetical protein
MKKERKISTILKPEIDEEAALRFASAVSKPTSGRSTDRFPGAKAEPRKLEKNSHNDLEKGMRQISLTIKKSLYDKVAKEAARKNRTVEEHLKRHLTKHYDK